jgi:hypothetical protein
MMIAETPSHADKQFSPRHTSILCTLPLSEASVSSNSPCCSEGSGAGTGVHGDGLADNEAILNQLADGLAGVGVGDFVDFIGIEPDLALSATDDGRRETLLCPEIDPVERGSQYQKVLLKRGRQSAAFADAGSIGRAREECARRRATCSN